MIPESRLIIDKFDTLIKATYQAESLISLDEYCYNKRIFTKEFIKVVRSRERLANASVDKDFQIDKEFVMISNDLKYYLGQMFLYKPYVNDTTTGTYIQSIYDRRYLMFASVCYQSIYNYWDRIGDLIWMFFETGLNEKDVYINKVLNNIKPEYKSSPNYNLIQELYNSDIKSDMDKRKQIVHYFQLESEFFNKSAYALFNETESEKIYQEKLNLTTNIKNQLGHMNKAIFYVLDFIMELPPK